LKGFIDSLEISDDVNVHQWDSSNGTVIKKMYISPVGCEVGLKEVSIVSILNAFKIPHIVNLLGITTDAEDFAAIFKFIEGEILESKLMKLINEIEPVLVIEEKQINVAIIETKDTDYYDEIMVLLQENEEPQRVKMTSIFQPEPFYIFPIKERIQLANQLLEAILDIHKAGFVHSDLHTGNIVIGDTGQITLIDFDKAEVYTEESSVADIIAFHEIVKVLLGIFIKERNELGLQKLEDWEIFFQTVTEADIASIIDTHETKLQSNTNSDTENKKEEKDS